MRNIDLITNRILQSRYIIPLLAFLIPIIIRTVPEILIGPYVLGFDTMGFYVPITLSWLSDGIDIFGYLSIAPLFYTILIAIVDAGIPIIIALKVISPLLLGVLGFSIYYYAHKGLGWSSTKGLATALLGTLYFVSLRISWDMLRNELGLIFLFIVLTLLTLSKNGSWKQYILLSLAMISVIVSHQLVSVIMLGIVLFTVVYGVYRKAFSRALYLIIASFPSVIFFFVVYFSSTVLPSGFQNYAFSAESPLANWLGFPTYQSMLLSEGGFFLYCYLPLLPLAIVSLKKLADFQLRSWLLLSLILLLIPFAFVSPFRWLLILIYPLAFYVIEALSRLKLTKWKHSKFTIRKLVILYLVISTSFLSLGYLISQPETPFVYFNPQYLNYYSNQIPTSMLQNTISPMDFQGTINALQWFKNNVTGNATLLTHTVFYGWALLTINNYQLRDYGFSDPSEAAALVKTTGLSPIYLIWWINGEGSEKSLDLNLPVGTLRQC